jgi:hypothetical protein
VGKYKNHKLFNQQSLTVKIPAKDVIDEVIISGTHAKMCHTSILNLFCKYQGFETLSGFLPANDR